MTFFNPWAFGFAGLVPVIVALYLLKVRRRPVAISTLMFWQRVLQENQRRALFQRLRQWLSLLLHLLIFALVLLALTRPTFDRAVHEGISTVLILDNRARMQALEPGGETRFVKARRAALAYGRQAGPSRQMAVESSRPSPRGEGAKSAGFARGFSGDERAIEEGLASFAPVDSGGDLQEAIRLAHDLLASRASGGRIVVFTDRVEPGVPAEFVTVGTPRDNVAITRFAARPLLASPETVEMLLEVSNFSRGPWSGNVDLSLNGRTIDVRPFSLAPGEKKAVVFSQLSSERGDLIARLPGGDALALDNVAVAPLRPAALRRVLLVTKGNWFLEKVLAADARLRFELLTPEAYLPEMAKSFDAVILDDLPGSALATGAVNFLYLRQSPFTVAGPEIVRPVVTEVDAQNPALRLANLEGVSFARAQPMAIPAEKANWQYEAPLRFGDQPLIITGAAPYGGHVAAFGFGVTDSDLPLRVAFPLLIASTLQWLTEQKTTEPDASENAPGLYDERESDLRVAGDAPASRATSLQAALPLGGWPLWQYLAAAAALLFCGEWWLFHRRQTE